MSKVRYQKAISKITVLPLGNNSKYVGLYYNSAYNKYEGTFSVGQYDETGSWKINYTYLRDNAGNT